MGLISTDSGCQAMVLEHNHNKIGRQNNLDNDVMIGGY